MKHLLQGGNFRYRMALVALALVVLAQIAASAGTPDHWCVHFGAYNQANSLGVYPTTHDGWNGQSPVGQPPDWGINYNGMYTVLYREHNADWAGPTGIYAEVYAAPIPWGGNKTWWDICLWSHNYTPPTPGQIAVRYSFYGGYDNEDPPEGYWGHLVIDQVPDGVIWTGPMNYWFDMTVNNQYFLMPLAEETNPLLGTRFHLTVYTPEPSSAAAILAGLAGFGAGRRVRLFRARRPCGARGRRT